MRRLIRIYDTTLRDGTQGEGVAFSMDDKVRIASRLDAIGIHYIEGGWPGSNPKDMRLFRRIQDVPLKHAKIAAFSMTRRPNVPAETDGEETWGTVGVADNIIEASWRALVDSVEYKLRRDERRGRG